MGSGFFRKNDLLSKIEIEIGSVVYSSKRTEGFFVIYHKTDIVGQIAFSMLRVCSKHIKADSYSFYLYDNLCIPIASYFPQEDYPELDATPIKTSTPIVDYMRKNKHAVGSLMPDVKEIWQRSTLYHVIKQRGLEYFMAGPLIHNGVWLGSINLSRKSEEFTEQELKSLEFLSNVVVAFFESSEILLKRGSIISIEPSDSGLEKLMIHNLSYSNFDASKLKLTNREEEIIKEMTEGRTYKETAEKLGISINTVKYHVKNIYHKAGASSKVRMIRTLYDD